MHLRRPGIDALPGDEHCNKGGEKKYVLHREVLSTSACSGRAKGFAGGGIKTSVWDLAGGERQLSRGGPGGLLELIAALVPSPCRAVVTPFGPTVAVASPCTALTAGGCGKTRGGRGERKAPTAWRAITSSGVIASPLPRRSCLLYTSPSPRDKRQSRMPSSA